MLTVGRLGPGQDRIAGRQPAAAAFSAHSGAKQVFRGPGADLLQDQLTRNLTSSNPARWAWTARPAAGPVLAGREPLACRHFR